MKFNKIYTFMASAAILAACDKADYSGFYGDEDVIRIESVSAAGFSDGTKASYAESSTKFEEGDRLGLIMISDGNWTNTPFTYQGGNWVSQTPLFYTSKVTKVIAYYPYNATLSGISSIEALKKTVDIVPDQSTAEAFTAMDLLVEDVAAPSRNMVIELSHAFSMVALSADASITLDGTTYNYNAEIENVAFEIAGQAYTPFLYGGAYACLLKDGTVLKNNEFKYSYTMSGKVAAKTVAGEVALKAGTKYTIRCSTGSPSGFTVSAGDFWCENSAGHVVVFPGNAASLPAGLACKGIVFHVMNDASAFLEANNLEESALPGYEGFHGLIVALQNGAGFGTGDAAAILAAYQTAGVADYSDREVMNGYALTQALKQADGLNFTALDPYAGQLAGATPWYAPSFMELKYMVRGEASEVASTGGSALLNKQFAKIGNTSGTMPVTIPSLTTNTPESGDLCLMTDDNENGWHGIPGESFRGICAF